MSGYTVSPTLFKMLGRKLYSEHVGVIAVRELLQNSRDAILARQAIESREGKKVKKGKISISINRHTTCTVIECLDNGIGMSQDTIVNKFLCLGESLKSSSVDNVGGFGIAKASLFVCAEWTCTTNEWCIDSKLVESNGIPVLADSPIKGTLINLIYDTEVNTEDKLYTNNIKDILSICLMSDLGKIELSVTIDGYEYHKVKGKAKLDNVFVDNGNKINMSIISALCFESEYSDYQMIDTTFYRLNGLVQFANREYSEKKVNVLVDIVSHHSTTDNYYPFTMSRESISYNSLRSEVQSQINKYNIDAITTQGKLDDKKNKFRVFNKNGDMITGLYNPDDAQEDKNPNELIKDISDTLFARTESPKILLKSTSRKSLTIRERQLIRVWSKVMSLVTGDLFYVGIIDDDDTMACRLVHEEQVYYMINPTYIDGITDKKAVIIALWHIAVHESCHSFSSMHNELFTSMENRIARGTSLCIINLVNEIVRRYMRRFDTN